MMGEMSAKERVARDIGFTLVTDCGMDGPFIERNDNQDVAEREIRKRLTPETIAALAAEEMSEEEIEHLKFSMDSWTDTEFLQMVLDAAERGSDGD